MVIELPKQVKQIITTLQEHGYEAYAVGGCVRDAMLGKEPQDWDITTSALPMQVKSLFRRTVDTGIQHGTVTVLLDKEGFEVTTYRVDGKYEDGRHPKEVAFTASLTEDLKRRDFTINAMAYNEKEGLVDLFSGAEDLDRGIIRCVGVAKERFSEDALRILRAFRFSAQLDFTIEEETLAAAKELAGTLRKISAERIYAELTKLLLSEHPGRLLTAYECDITEVILPEFDRMCETPQRHPAHYTNVGLHSLDTVRTVKQMSEYGGTAGFSSEEFRYLRLAALFHDVGKPDCRSTDAEGIDHFHGHAEAGADSVKKILRRLKADNATIDTVSRLVRWHDYPFVPEERPMRRAMHKIGADLIPLLLELRRGDLVAHAEPYRTEGPENLRKVWQVFLGIKSREECTSLKDLAVNGSDLIAAGFAPGKELGEVLNRLLLSVIEAPELNQKEVLLAEAKKKRES
ncbi:MAG: CCA tRNA nucleotidyltransferase [Lachnospiraceae bacterium]|nr:CCA tRNA nucleotidyltransferase [Lachnospiraceae bacterium]